MHAIYAVFQSYFRPRRIARLRQILPMLDREGTSVLDVGGTVGWWRLVRPATVDITILNLDSSHKTECEHEGYRFVSANACGMPFADQSFDLAHSNSLIEHVGNFDQQHLCAREIMRCGKAFYVQTPNRWFPVEPHLITVFVHWLPFAVQRRLVRWLSVWGWMYKPTQAEIDDFLNGIRLLNLRAATHSSC